TFTSALWVSFTSALTGVPDLGVMRPGLAGLAAAMRKIPPVPGPMARPFGHAWSRPWRWLIIDSLTQGKQ
ncbi:hypothetical protein, partial [Xanthomonas citri]|uniref:hypothetical protein n=1 Tax=Xanthomonas citri TaxID=346 RepID=UPI001980468F